MQPYQRGRIEVHRVGAGLWIRQPGGDLLIDVPSGVERFLASHGALRDLRAVVISTDRMRSMAGLLALCDAVTSVRGADPALHVVVPIHAERASMLASTWQQGWPDGLRLEVDALVPGTSVPVAASAEVRFEDLSTDELRPDGVRPVPGAGVRVEVGDVVIAWVPSSRPGAAPQRVCTGADLAVVEVAKVGWPRTERPLRLDVDQARRVAVGAKALWLLGDDGSWVEDATLDN